MVKGQLPGQWHALGLEVTKAAHLLCVVQIQRLEAARNVRRDELAR